MGSESTVVIGGLIASLGLVVGSFLNALVWRLHEKKPIGGKERSQCTHCAHELAWYDLIPVLSWVMLRGKCRYCKKPISIQYPLVELITASVWLISYKSLQPDQLLEYVLLSIWLCATAVLIALAVYDARWMLLPDKLVLPFSVLGVVYAFLVLAQAETTFQAISPFLGVIAVAGFFYALFALSDGTWIGGGDVKLGVGMGLFLGLEKGLLAVFIAALLGSIFGVVGIALFKRDRKSLIPFGPFLITATVISFLCGQYMIDWYINQLI